MRIRNLALAVAALSMVAFAALASADTTEMWVNQHDGGGDFIDSGTMLSLAPDGHLIVAGESTEVTGGADLFVRKLDKTDGSLIWNFRYDGIDDKDVAITEVTWDSAGQLLISGYIKSCVG